MKNQTRGRVLPAVPVSRETPRGPIRGETRRPVSGRPVRGNGNGNKPNLGTISIYEACKYVSSHGICNRVLALLPTGNMNAIQQLINAFAASENISPALAQSLIEQCCKINLSGSDRYACYDDGTCQPAANGQYTSLADCEANCGDICKDNDWLDMPQGVASGNQTWWGKADYCQRCAVDNNNPSGQAQNGNLPIYITSTAPYWNPSPSGKNYCVCCPPTTTSGDYSCLAFQLGLTLQQQQGYCQKWQQAQGNPTAIQAELQNLATALGISTSYAQWIFDNCCGDLNTGPCPPSNPNSPFYTYPNFCNTDYCVDSQGNPLPSHHPDCICCPNWTDPTGPCPPPPNSPYHTNPNEFCPQCGPGLGYDGHPDCQCCPGNGTGNQDVVRWRCDAGGCLQCPPGTDASICPHSEPTCNNSCGVPTNTSYSRASGPEPSAGTTIKQAGLGAGLFTAAAVIGGVIFLLSRVGKK